MQRTFFWKISIETSQSVAPTLDCIIHLKCGIRLHEYILVQRLLTLMVLRFHFKQRWYSQLQQSFREKSECLESVETTEGQEAQFKLGEFYSNFFEVTGGWWLTFLQRNSSGGQLLSGWKKLPLNDCGSDFQVWMWRVRPHQTSPTGLHQSPGLRPGIWRVAAVSWWGSSGGDQRLESCTAVHLPWGWCTFAAHTHSGIAPVIDNSSSSVHCLFCVGLFQIFNFRYFCFSFWIRTTQNTQVS